MQTKKTHLMREGNKERFWGASNFSKILMAANRGKRKNKVGGGGHKNLKKEGRLGRPEPQSDKRTCQDSSN